jgi:hypothetical protein
VFQTPQGKFGNVEWIDFTVWYGFVRYRATWLWGDPMR